MRIKVRRGTQSKSWEEKETKKRSERRDVVWSTFWGKMYGSRKIGTCHETGPVKKPKSGRILCRNIVTATNPKITLSNPLIHNWDHRDSKKSFLAWDCEIIKGHRLETLALGV